MKKIHITILTEFFYPSVGGLQKQCLDICSALESEYLSFTVLTPQLQSSAPLHEIIQGVEVRRLGPVGYSMVAKVLRATRIFALLSRFERHTDLVHVWGVSKLILPSIAFGKIFRKPVILQAGGADLLANYSAFSQDDRSPTQLKIKKIFQKMIIRQVPWFIALSQEIQEQLFSLGIEMHRIFRLPNTVDRKRFLPISTDAVPALRKKLRLPPGILIMVVGKLAQRKGLELMLQTFCSLREHDPKLRLIFVGSGHGRINSCEEKLRSMIRSLHAHHDVIITGDVENVHEFLQAADLFVLPSEQEGMSRALLEAMAAGLPCIATSVGAATEVIRDEIHGLLIPPSNAQALSSALTRLIGDPDLRQRLGRAASARMDAFSIKAVMPQFRKLYQDLTGS